jgi:predicted O-methyltransferase YrrM
MIGPGTQIAMQLTTISSDRLLKSGKERSMLDFEEIYQTRVERCSHETAFNKEESKALFDLAMTLPENSTMLEIGIEFGRSTTLLGHVAKENNLIFVAIDSWIGEYGEAAKTHVEQVLLGEWQLPIEILHTTSLLGAYDRQGDHFDLVHIDGDHSYESVLIDCTLWLPYIFIGGYACFDDYGHESLPDVYRAVQYWMTNVEPGCWELVGRYGNKLGVFRRIK